MKNLQIKNKSHQNRCNWILAIAMIHCDLELETKVYSLTFDRLQILANIKLQLLWESARSLVLL